MSFEAFHTWSTIYAHKTYIANILLFLNQKKREREKRFAPCVFPYSDINLLRINIDRLEI